MLNWHRSFNWKLRIFGRRWCVTYPGAILKFFRTREAALKYLEERPYCHLYRHGLYSWHEEEWK